MVCAYTIGMNSDQTRVKQGSSGRQTDQAQADTKPTNTCQEPGQLVTTNRYECRSNTCELALTKLANTNKDTDTNGSVPVPSSLFFSSLRSNLDKGGSLLLKEDSTRLPYSILRYNIKSKGCAGFTENSINRGKEKMKKTTTIILALAIGSATLTVRPMDCQSIAKSKGYDVSCWHHVSGNQYVDLLSDSTYVVFGQTIIARPTTKAEHIQSALSSPMNEGDGE